MSDFDRLYRKYYHSLFRYSKKFVDNDEDASDLVQDVFVAIYRKKIYDENDDFVKSYLFNALRNHCLNYIKHLHVVKRYEKNAASELKEMEIMFYSSGEKSLIEKESCQDLYSLINSLTDVHREIIILSRVEGLKNKEIAERLQIPVRTVETRLFRALSQLKAELSQKKLMILLSFNWLKQQVRGRTESY